MKKKLQNNRYTVNFYEKHDKLIKKATKEDSKDGEREKSEGAWIRDEIVAVLEERFDN